MSDIQIAAGVNTFNDAKSLARTLQTITPYFNTIYIIDGRYPDYSSKSNEEYSRDGTVELVDSYSNCVYIPFAAEQKEKRTKYLQECSYDFLVVIDSDEYMKVQSWSHFQDCIQRQILNMPDKARTYQYAIAYEAEPNKTIYLPRLFYKPNELMYTTHWTVISNPVTHRRVENALLIEGITLSTDDNLRPATRIQEDIDYQWLLFLKEGVISEKVYRDTECKANFEKQILWEVKVWKDYEHTYKPKYVARFNDSRRPQQST